MERKNRTLLYSIVIATLPTVSVMTYSHGGELIDYLIKGPAEEKIQQPLNPRLQRPVPMPEEIPIHRDDLMVV